MKDDIVISSPIVFIQKLVFQRGNLVGLDHPLPAVAEAFLFVQCSLPSSVVLIVDEPGMFNISHSFGSLRISQFEVNKLDVIHVIF